MTLRPAPLQDPDQTDLVFSTHPVDTNGLLLENSDQHSGAETYLPACVATHIDRRLSRPSLSRQRRCGELVTYRLSVEAI